MTKTVAVLGSTGSIGRQTLQVVQELGLTVAALTANRQVDLLEQQARQLHPKLAVLYDRAAAGELRLRLSDTDIRVAEGPEGLLEAATLPEADTVVTAVMGSVGLEPTLAAIREGQSPLTLLSPLSLRKERGCQSTDCALWHKRIIWAKTACPRKKNAML